MQPAASRGATPIFGGAFQLVDTLSGSAPARQRRQRDAAQRLLVPLGASVPFASTHVFDREVVRYALQDGSNDARMPALRATNKLSKRTAIYLTAGFIDNDGAAAVSASAGGSIGAGLWQTGVMACVRHAF